MTFEENCKKNNITTTKIQCTVTIEVYNYLQQKSNEMNCTLDDYLRTMIDYFIEQEVD